MSEFTNGKWEVVNAGKKQYQEQHFWGYHVFSGAKHIAKISEVLDDNGYNTLANARLIAAAPEMYELLKDLLSYVHKAYNIARSITYEVKALRDIERVETLFARIDGEKPQS